MTKNNKELLIEIYSEEIPARMQVKAMEDFKKIFIEFFEKQNIKFQPSNLKTFITPRRLVLLIEDLEITQKSAATNKMGPKIDAPENAIKGFLRSVGLTDKADLETIDRQNGKYYFYRQEELEIETAKILEKNIASLFQKMSGTWLKTMDLIDLTKRSNWVRPVRNILVIFNNEILKVDFANLAANNKTFGHLLLGKKSLQVTDFKDYKKQLEDNFVILDWNERREIIANEIKEIDKKSLTRNAKLIDEIAGLVEYPQVLVGSIDDEFNKLPHEVLELVIKLHQKAILFKDDKSLKFIFVSNIKADKKSTLKIIADNEKVVRARLSDAKFYIEEDLKTPFKERVELLKDIVFHKKIGSLYGKVKRLEILNKFLVIWIPQAKLSLAEQLADLAKNDLTTKTVAELPELQGVIGKYYTKYQGEDSEISTAISEQYLPTGKDSHLPKTPLGTVLAIADKIDNICALFLAGDKPTASKDPYAIRRAALGIIRILLEKQIYLPIRIVVEKSINSFPSKNLKLLYPQNNASEIADLKRKTSLEIINFFIERIKSHLKDQFKLRSDVVNQIFEEYLENAESKKLDFLEISQKAIFVDKFIGNEDGAKIIKLYK
ncbi:MAG: glycyl-tRNA synthetase beta chain, partial [Lentimonas sp.]